VAEVPTVNELLRGIAATRARVRDDGEVGRRDSVVVYAKGEIETILLGSLRKYPVLPSGRRDFEIRDGAGRLVTVPDFTWPDVRLAVFCDGFSYHRYTLAQDARKRNWLTAFGWAYFTFWAVQIKLEPDLCAKQVARLYRYRRLIPGLWKREDQS